MISFTEVWNAIGTENVGGSPRHSFRYIKFEMTVRHTRFLSMQLNIIMWTLGQGLSWKYKFGNHEYMNEFLSNGARLDHLESDYR